MATAPSLFKALNGVFCIYKPAGKSINLIINAIAMNLARELNKLPCRPMRTKLEISEGLVSTVSMVPDLSDHPLAVGPRYQREDFHINCLDSLDTFSSGLSVLGISRGTSIIRPICDAKYLKVYHVDGEFGRVSWDHKSTGKIAEQTTYRHVTSATVDRIVAAMQANHQRHMFLASGVDLQSEQAYKMACAGMVRPQGKNKEPVIYGMKVIYFKPPHFTIEIHAIDETCGYLAKLIHNIGLEARSSAFCTKIRRIKYGRFGLELSLLLKHASNPVLLAENIVRCRELINFQNTMHLPNLTNHVPELPPPPSSLE